VHPSRRGTGIGKALLQFAEGEARRAGFDSVYLYTHEQMTENLALYSRIGYVEYDRRSQGAFSLVYMRKQLGSVRRSWSGSRGTIGVLGRSPRGELAQVARLEGWSTRS
jgi:L-amino acid N-acyltransferase YncA